MSTKIQWTDETWNPTTGCTKISPGCANCYIERTPAFRIAGRTFDRHAHIPLVLHVDRLETPLHWRKPRRVFVNSLSDLFHDDVPDVFIERVFSVMALAERHAFQVLTKRPERMLAWFKARRFDVKGYAILQTENAGECLYAHPWPLPNVWLGCSVENQRFADERIPLLLQTPAAVRFISAEPLLGPVDASFYLDPICECETRETVHSGDQHDDSCPAGGGKLDWVIVGGESGPGARKFNLEWARSIIDQCKAAGVPCFYKQGGRSNRCVHDSKGGCFACMPTDLQIREFPDAARS